MKKTINIFTTEKKKNRARDKNLHQPFHKELQVYQDKYFCDNDDPRDALQAKNSIGYENATTHSKINVSNYNDTIAHTPFVANEMTDFTIMFFEPIHWRKKSFCQQSISYQRRASTIRNKKKKKKKR
jgi:hypothetical protein